MLVRALMNSWLCLVHLLPDLAEFRYKADELNAVEYLLFSWKSAQGRSYISLDLVTSGVSVLVHRGSV